MRWEGLVLVGTLALVSGCGRSAPPAGPAAKGEPADKAFHLSSKSDAKLANDQLTRLGYGPKKPLPVTFFLYFGDKAKAEAAASDLTKAGFATETHQMDGTKDWSCTGMKTLAPGTPEFDSAFEATGDAARKHGGEYDGWEVENR